MKQMIQDLLEYSRVSTRCGEFKSADSNIIIRNVIESLNATILENNANIPMKAF